MLKHLRVLDLTSGLGALAGRMLAELGAQVLKIEPPEGDPARTDALSWAVWNAGKRSIALDLTTAENTGHFLDLVATADILLRNGEDERFPYAALAARNPRLIDVLITNFSAAGPLASRPATDLTLMARSGLMTIVGDPDRPPLRLPGEQAFALTGIQAVSAALTALYARTASGRGQQATVSAYQSAVLANYREPVMWAWTGRVGNRTGNLLVRGKSGVKQIWRCKDGFVTWSIIDNPGMMRSMVRLMNAENMAGPLAVIDWDKTLVADTPRETLEIWEAQVALFLETHEKTWLSAQSTELGFGLSGIDEPDDVLNSAQQAARGLWRDDEQNGIKLPGPLFATSEPGTITPRPAPALGEANQDFGVGA